MLSYLVVIFALLPLMVATGLSMSPGVDAGFHWLPELFGGRQGARSAHFIVALLIVLFVLAHIVMVVLSGPINNLRSMITGRYRLPE
jgi:thiosulfate reductase cytochrome b subunit